MRGIAGVASPPQTAQNMLPKLERSIRSETEISWIIVGPIPVKHGYKVKRLKQSCPTIEPEYPTQTYTIPTMALSWI
jgi:hypothetical protein